MISIVIDCPGPWNYTQHHQLLSKLNNCDSYSKIKPFIIKMLKNRAKGRKGGGRKSPNERNSNHLVQCFYFQQSICQKYEKEVIPYLVFFYSIISSNRVLEYTKLLFKFSSLNTSGFRCHHNAYTHGSSQDYKWSEAIISLPKNWKFLEQKLFQSFLEAFQDLRFHNYLSDVFQYHMILGHNTSVLT